MPRKRWVDIHKIVFLDTFIFLVIILLLKKREKMHKFKKGQIVLVKMDKRELKTKIIGLVEDRLFYFIDWENCGYNKILNTVKISEKALSSID